MTIPIWPYYIKILEAYLIVSIPLILFIFIKNARFFSTSSTVFILIVFISFFALNYLSGRISVQYISEHEITLYYFRLGVIFLISLVIIVGLTKNFHCLVDSIYHAFIIAGLLILLWIVLFPQYKTSLQRFTGPLGDPSYTSAFLTISTNISTYLAFISKKKMIRVGSLLLSAIFFMTIVSSLSRAPLLGTLISLLILYSVLAVSPRSNFAKGMLIVKRIYFNKVIAASLLLIVAVTVLFAARPTLRTKLTRRMSIENILSEKDQHRQTIWRLGIRSIAQNPIGYGMGQMRAKHRLLDPDYTKFGHSTEVHNLVLQVGGAFGWLGLFVFIMFLFFLLRVCVRLLRKRTYPAGSVSMYPVPLVTSFIGLFAQSMVYNFLYLKHFWMVAVLVLAYHEYEKRKIRLGLKTIV